MSFKVKDHYFKKAKHDNYLARSVYKLEEIDNKFKILNTGDQVLDLGYFPGSWIQYTASKIGNNGNVVGIDIQDVNKKLLHMKNVFLYKKDVFSLKSLSEINRDKLFTCVLSDMAPNTTGIKCVDQDRSLGLVEEVFSILPVFLKVTGNFIIKIFDSNDAQVFLKQNMKKNFKENFSFRPKSTRSVSKEFFVIGKSYKG